LCRKKLFRGHKLLALTNLNLILTPKTNQPEEKKLFKNMPIDYWTEENLILLEEQCRMEFSAARNEGHRPRMYFWIIRGNFFLGMIALLRAAREQQRRQ
jgi:hypothetical protein